MTLIKAIDILEHGKTLAPRGCRHDTFKALMGREFYLDFMDAVNVVGRSCVKKEDFYENNITVACFVNYLIKLYYNRKY